MKEEIDLIPVRLITVAGDEYEIELPSNMSANELLSQLIIVMKLPTVDPSGKSCDWRLAVDIEGGRIYLEDSDIIGAYAPRNETLKIYFYRRVYAGG